MKTKVPFSVFPSTYRNEETSETTEVQTDERVTVQGAGREDRRYQQQTSEQRIPPQGRPSRRDDRYTQEDIQVTQDNTFQGPGRFQDRTDTRVDIDVDQRNYRRRPGQGYTDNTEIDVEDRVSDRSYSNQATYGTNIDVTERDYRDRTVPFTEEYRTSRGWEDKSTYPRQVPADSNIGRRGVRFDDQVNITEETTTVDPPREGGRRHRLDMGYYDEEGQYHSFRRGLHRAADRILHPFESRERVVDREEDVIVEDREVNMGGGARYGPEIGQRSSVSYAERRGPPNTVTIPCHFVRIGDLLILQGRPCQVIRITTSAQTGQYRYLGVDLFTKQLQEESSFVSNPSPSVVVQSVIGPVFKQYRVLDIRDDGRVVAMTETGDVKQGLPVLEQSNLFSRVSNSFNNGRGSVRVLVINDEGRELVVDYKVIHGSRL